jgi:gliding motility-associated lipoprotein GldD
MTKAFNKNIFGCIFLLVVIVLISCNSDYSHKKKGYYKIALPSHQYRQFSNPAFPYAFEYPVYANIIQDSTFFDLRPENDYWLNIDFPTLHARIFLSYKIVGGKAVFKKKQTDGSYKDSVGINYFDLMVNDAFNLTNKNDVIATSITDSLMHTPNGITGLYFKVGGNAATATQFFLTDTVKHFLRGALYFDATPNADSLKPVQDFLHKDIEHLINTFYWKSN